MIKVLWGHFCEPHLQDVTSLLLTTFFLLQSVFSVGKFEQFAAPGAAEFSAFLLSEPGCYLALSVLHCQLYSTFQQLALWPSQHWYSTVTAQEGHDVCAQGGTVTVQTAES